MVLVWSFEFKLGLWLLIVGGIVLRRLVLLAWLRNLFTLVSMMLDRQIRSLLFLIEPHITLLYLVNFALNLFRMVWAIDDFSLIQAHHIILRLYRHTPHIEALGVDRQIRHYRLRPVFWNRNRRVRNIVPVLVRYRLWVLKLNMEVLLLKLLKLAADHTLLVVLWILLDVYWQIYWSSSSARSCILLIEQASQLPN